MWSACALGRYDVRDGTLGKVDFPAISRHRGSRVRGLSALMLYRYVRSAAGHFSLANALNSGLVDIIYDLYSFICKKSVIMNG